LMIIAMVMVAVKPEDRSGHMCTHSHNITMLAMSFFAPWKKQSHSSKDPLHHNAKKWNISCTIPYYVILQKPYHVYTTNTTFQYHLFFSIPIQYHDDVITEDRRPSGRGSDMIAQLQ
jgi:hypothetical protein